MGLGASLKIGALVQRNREQLAKRRVAALKELLHAKGEDGLIDDVTNIVLADAMDGDSLGVYENHDDDDEDYLLAIEDDEDEEGLQFSDSDDSDSESEDDVLNGVDIDKIVGLARSRSQRRLSIDASK